MTYGFVVGAFLLLSIHGEMNLIPFETYEDCKIEEAFYRSQLDQYRSHGMREASTHCIKTGASEAPKMTDEQAMKLKQSQDYVRKVFGIDNEG